MIFTKPFVDFIIKLLFVVILTGFKESQLSYQKLKNTKLFCYYSNACKVFCFVFYLAYCTNPL